ILYGTEETAEIFGISHILKRDCRTLSGGEKVLTAAASAAAGHPKLIVLDEPDSHLDEQTACELSDALLKMEIPHIIWASHRKFAEGFEVVL
ncbi:MAG TPA: ATP-binding cassette domain-containing protein, partial [Methanocorpusculum sp.]|nr:ATP-binding cassette domain-containing protein [Methanocorpusculum sp.]